MRTIIPVFLIVSSGIATPALAGPIRLITTDQAQKGDQTIVVPDGGLNLSFLSSPGEKVGKGWLEGKSQFAIDSDTGGSAQAQGAQVTPSGSRVLHLKKIHLPNLSGENQGSHSTLSFITEGGSSGTKLYVFNLVAGSGKPAYHIVSIVPSSAPPAPAVTTAFTQSVQSGLDIAVSKKFVKPGDPLYTKVQSFIQYTQQGKAQIEAEQLAGVSPVLVSKLSTLGTSSTVPTLASAAIPQPQAPSLEKETEKDASPAVASAPVRTQPNPQAQKPEEEPKPELNEKPPITVAPQPSAPPHLSAATALARYKIVLDDGKFIPAVRLLDLQESIWHWEKGKYRKQLARFVSSLWNSTEEDNDKAILEASKASGLSLNDIKYFISKAPQKA